MGKNRFLFAKILVADLLEGGQRLFFKGGQGRWDSVSTKKVKILPHQDRGGPPPILVGEQIIMNQNQGKWVLPHEPLSFLMTI